MKNLVLIFVFCFIFCANAFGQEAEKIVEFENIPCDQYLAEMDNAVIYSQNNPTAQIYILIYEGKEFTYNKRKKKSEFVNSAKGTAEAKIGSIKKYYSIRKYPTDRIVFVKAGFREETTVEIWLVPEGVEPPKPSPTLKEIKYRKGKAIGFCTDCCGIE